MNFVATKMAIVAIEIEKNFKKFMLRHINICCDTITKNKAEISIATKEDYVVTIKIVD